MKSISYIIQSKIDNKQFEVNQNVIDASVLLKNISEFVEVDEPIIINCSNQSLEIFIKLINHIKHDISDDEHDTKYENELYRNFSDEQLIELIQDLCIVDSDFFFDSVTDYILAKMEAMTSTEIQEYLGLEDDFTAAEREIMEKNKTEYFLSINIDGMEFPFENKPLYSMKTKFLTPFNALIARIIQRSNELISYKLSTINKTIKNEIDRHPLKLTSFESSWNTWSLQIDKPEFRTFSISLDTKIHDDKYFNVVLQRKVIADKFEISYNEYAYESYTRCSSLSFAIPRNKLVEAKVRFQNDRNFLMYNFDVTKCSIPCIFYEFGGSVKSFKEVYDHLVAKALSKQIRLLLRGLAKFQYPNAHLFFYKMSNSPKLHSVRLYHVIKFFSQFETFITNYIDDDGYISCATEIKEIPIKKCIKYEGRHIYTVDVIKQYFDKIVITK